MNFSRRRWRWFLLFVVFDSIHFSSSQSNSQNLETFFPFPIPVPSPAPAPANSNSLPNSTLPPPSLAPAPGDDSVWDKPVVKAVVATAGSTFVIATVLFFLIQWQVSRRRRKRQVSADSGGGPPPGVVRNQSGIVDREKGEIVDENGLDMLYWRQLQEANKNDSFRQNGRPPPPPPPPVESESDDDEEEPVRRRSKEPEIPLLRGKSSFSHKKIAPEFDSSSSNRSMASAANYLSADSPNTETTIERPTPPPPPPPAPPPQTLRAIPAEKRRAPPPPPPNNKNAAPPPPGPPTTAVSDEPSNGNNQIKLKPLHWDKVNKNTDHSMVWDKIGGGSFRVDDGLMEALFGYVATNRKTEHNASSSNNQSNNGQAKIALLDPRKSRNAAIVLKTLTVSTEEILEALVDGGGLDSDTLEKLIRLAPSKDEELQILDFDGDPATLADAESFLVNILRAVPSAFSQVNAMLFRLNYDSEVLQFKESLQTLELGCKELRSRGLFMKLLEAVLKAGNRMNEGTSRGNAQAFDLSSLQKLSDVKSTDGKTTLLHFIVEEVVRSEGKRCFISRNKRLSQAGSSSNLNPTKTPSKEEREKEYMMLGLPLIGGLSAEFSNVKNAANIDYSAFEGTCSVLSAKMEEIRQIGASCYGNGEDGFLREMKGFIESGELEIKMMKDEQMRVMELVRSTTEYYQSGASKNKNGQPLGLFIIIRDFLNKVDQVCVEIARELQRRKPKPLSSGIGSPPKSPAFRMRAKFPDLPEHFLNEKTRSNSSESDTDF